MTHRCDPSPPPPPSCADGVDECDVNCMVCCKLSPVSDPRRIVLRRRPRCPDVNPDGNPDPNPSPKNLTIDGMTNHARWSPSTFNFIIQNSNSFVIFCLQCYICIQLSIIESFQVEQNFFLMTSFSLISRDAVIYRVAIPPAAVSVRPIDPAANLSLLWRWKGFFLCSDLTAKSKN